MEDSSMTLEQIINSLEHNCQWLAELRELLSKLKQAHEVLKEYETRYRTFFLLSDEVLFIYNSELKIVSISPNVERLLGYKPEEMVGKSFHELGVVDPKDREEAFDQAQHMLSVGIVSTSIYRFLKKNGEKRFCEVKSVPYMMDGRVTGVLCIGKDITERVTKESR